MTHDQWILVAVTFATIGLMFGARLRADLVAILAALTLDLTGVIPDGGVFEGLGSTVVLTLIGLFIVAEGLEETGVVRWAASRLSTLGSGSESRLLAALLAPAAGLSLAMNNVAVAALLLPASMRVARSARVPPSSVLLPVAFATLLGGMATIFTTGNIIMSDLVMEHGGSPLQMMDFVGTGGIVAVMGMVYLLVASRRLLPAHPLGAAGGGGDFFGLYELGERFWELHVLEGSALVGKTVEEIGFRKNLGLSVLAVLRRHRTFLVPGPGIVVAAGDRILILGRGDRVGQLTDEHVSLRSGASPTDLHDELELTEVVVPPRSRASGRTLTELEFRTRYGLTGLALWREGRVIRTDVGTTPLEVGDGLLVVNVPRRIEELTRGGDFLHVRTALAAPERPERAPVAVGVLATVLLVTFAGALPVGETVLAGAMVMVLTGCVTMEQAYKAVEWHVIFLVAGLLPLGFAMIDTGLAQRAASLLTGLARGGGMSAVILMFLVAAGTTQLIGGQVSALLVGPIALAVAEAVGVDLRAMAVAVAIGASAAFLTPMAHPVNAMMMGPGGYRPIHFLRVGVGMIAIALVGLVLGMRIFWGVTLAP